MSDTLADALPREMKRVRELIPLYELVPENAGAFAIAMMRNSLALAEKAMAEGDVVQMIAAYAQLKEFEE